MTRLTSFGAEQIVAAAFGNAQVALFDGPTCDPGSGRQVTEWVAYDPTVNTGVESPEFLDQAWVEVRDLDTGSWGRWPAGHVVAPGDTVAAPSPSHWFRAPEWS